MLGYLRYVIVLLVGVGVFAVCPTFLVTASEPVRLILSDHSDNNVRPRLRYIVPAAMQESLPFDGTTGGTTSSVSQNVNSKFDSVQISPQLPRALPSTEMPQPDPQVPTAPTNPTPITPTPTNAIPPELEPINSEPVINNPFQYRLPDGEGLIPRNISSLPSGIQVIGILMLRDQKSIAAIRLPRTGNQRISEIYYIREGDIIEIPSNLLPNRRTTPSRETDVAEILFLVVEKITPQHVEVRSRSNIADKHIIR
ncbi:MAG: hypothetical protein LBE12_14385 [Planctomycetaceae bacterium]|nr:hypothetical protein [Planctomycetaceae bacterium]